LTHPYRTADLHPTTPLAPGTPNPVHILWGSLYRWISSSASKLYDPALHRLVHKLITKVFHQLIAEIRNLGGTIIFASFNKLIIGTDKTKLSDAEVNFKFLSKTLRTRRPLFKFITLKPVQYWDVLLFKDLVNFIGIPATNQDPSERILGQIQPTALWNLSEFLPQAIRTHFLIVLVFYIRQLYKTKPTSLLPGDQRTDAKDVFEADKRGTSAYNLIDDITTRRNQELSKGDKETLADVKERLYGLTKQVLSTVASEINDDEKQVVLFQFEDSTHELNWPLEFVKTVCYVLALNKKTEQEMNSIRRNLLKMVGAREFSAETEFKDPSISFLMPDVICGFCNDCRDVDLLRDPFLLKHDWECSKCGHTLNKAKIENRLIDLAKKRCVAFQNQDLVCTKCGIIKASNTRTICPHCSGSFLSKESPQQCRKGFVTLLTIAKYHKFEYLEEVVESILKF